MIRASSMPLAQLCPASLHPKVAVDSHDPTADTGTEVHRAIALALKGEHPEFTGDDAAAKEHMVALALEWADQYHFDQYEWHLKAAEFSGTIDAARVGDKTARIVDWKTGWKLDTDHEAQIIIYAYLIFEIFPHIEQVIATIARPRHARADEKNYTRAWVAAWVEEFRRNVINQPDTFSPGEHCGHCPRKMECPALVQQNQQTALALLDTDKPLSLLNRTDFASLRPRVKLLKDAIEKYEEILRADIRANGPVEAGGKVLKLMSVEQDEIALDRGWEVLQGQFTDTEIASFVKVGKTAMLAIISEKTAKGKAAAQTAMMEKLRAAGAVTKREITKLVETKGEPQ